jgi:hypothetical protein
MAKEEDKYKNRQSLKKQKEEKKQTLREFFGV